MACRRALLAWMALGAACADLELVDPARARLEPHHVALTYSTNEDLTAVRWRSDAAPVEPPELLVGDGWVPYSELAAEVRSSADFTWAALLPGRHDAPRLRVATEHGHRLTFRLEADLVEAALTFDAALGADNLSVEVSLEDPFAQGPLPIERDFEVVVRESGCTSPVVSAEVSGSATVGLPELLPDTTGAGACAELASGAAHFSVPLFLHPELEHSALVHMPPTVFGKVVVLPAMNLELPDATQCQALRQALHDSLAAVVDEVAPGGVVAATVSPPLGTDGACHHQGSGWLDWWAYDMAFGPHAGDPDITLILVYVDNLNLALSPEAQLELDYYTQWSTWFGSSFHAAALATPAVSGSYPFVWSEGWTYAADPELPGRLADLTRAVVPLWRWAETSAPWQPLFPGVTLTGVGLKLCATNASLELDPWNGVFTPLGGGSPSFRVWLPVGWSPAALLVQAPVTADLELCRRYCTLAAAAWTDAPECWSTP